MTYLDDYNRAWMAAQEAARKKAEAEARAKAEAEAKARQAAYDWEMFVYNENLKKTQQKEKETVQQANVTSFLGENPQATFSSFITSLTPDLQNYYKDKYYDLYNEYQANVANQVKAGAAEQTDFNTFLKGLNLADRYKGLTNYQRGFYTPNVAPRTRFLTSY